jgi:hypothetical protein
MEVTSPKGFTGPVQIQLLNDIVFKVEGFNNIFFLRVSLRGTCLLVALGSASAYCRINCNFMILILGC